MADIWKSIRECRVVIAELTGKNPNVFYELGLAHAIGKSAIVITRNKEDVPFDLKALRYIYYDPSDPFWGENLRKSIEGLLKKVLHEKSFGSGLEGITLSSELGVLDQPIKPIHVKTIPSPYTVAGLWRADWTEKLFSPNPCPHHAIMNLVQEGNKVGGDITISMMPPGTGTEVVVEMLDGTIDGNQMALQGVSYTITKPGSENADYLLDSFSLTILSHEKMMGVLKSGGKVITKKLEFHRVEGTQPSNKSNAAHAKSRAADWPR